MGHFTGSIPACAGEPPAAWTRRGSAAVYPRVCGGTAWVRLSSVSMSGLSPRVRGNRIQAPVAGHQHRSIPACAGEPPYGPGDCGRSGVYPRVCGGTVCLVFIPRRVVGLSPRVRGNLGGRSGPRRLAGSIPACAGEPSNDTPVATPTGVYPRVCGGTGYAYTNTNIQAGLSPRVRGNLDRVGPGHAGLGSIPACAGEPHRLPARPRWSWVYPRVCGGT